MGCKGLWHWCVMKKIAVLVAVILRGQDVQCSLQDGSLSTFDNDTKGVFVNTQNVVRRYAGAANMKKLSWDDTLAKDCERIVENCPGSPYGDVEHTMDIGGSGENYYWESGNFNVQNALIVTATGAWQSQSNITKCESKHTLCQEYNRQVWADNEKMGCAAAYCSSSSSKRSYIEGMLVCCKFGPVQVVNETQYEDPNDLFIRGEPCSQCDDRYVCEEKLCVACEKTLTFCPNTTMSTSTTIITTTASTASSGQASINNATTKTVSVTTSGCKNHRLADDLFRCFFAIFIFLLKLLFD